ncbi:MAG: hypothetical protein R3321_04595 [Nitrososphaeraceae archaeon]|nr:hypothetical protein [Nitrososphaeraceae archaeon]
MIQDSEGALLDKVEVIVCQHCNNPNELFHKVLSRRGQKNYHISLEEPVIQKLKHMCVDYNCDINEVIKMLLYKIYMYEIKNKKPNEIITSIKFDEVIRDE